MFLKFFFLFVLFLPENLSRTVCLQHSAAEVFSLPCCVGLCYLGDGHSGDYLSVSFHLPSAVNTRKKMKTEERKICLDYQEPMNPHIVRAHQDARV